MKKLNFYVIPIILLLCIGGSVGISMLVGYWQTERSATPATLADGSYDPEDIRGSNTIAEVLEFYEIPKDDFYDGLHLPTSVKTGTQLKELEKLVITEDVDSEGEEHFGVSDVRDFVAQYRGLGSIEANSLDDFDSHQNPDSLDSQNTSLSGANGNVGLNESVDTEVEHTEVFTSPKGGTPLAQVYEWGVTKEMLEKKFNIDIDKLGLTPESTLKDFTEATGEKMFDVKEYISSVMTQ